ncbi:MAG: hypothetical protein C7B47_16715 [Sulfobacillus thermosulfidooxidans]|uniref:Uncharacterized protein n=1 Tax=Sulfobacillus thermosulfidooxidans TaxID=28034 RepID=A0A2T2WJC3_SULTH|nr:MAG: hypothetical protein C7B47_16715 [Sulfobacillus thermosulfidooxidans]
MKARRNDTNDNPNVIPATYNKAIEPNTSPTKAGMIKNRVSEPKSIPMLPKKLQTFIETSLPFLCLETLALSRFQPLKWE